MRKIFSSDAAILAGGGGSPVQQNERISIIDTLRGIALLGILLMNIPFFGMPFQVGNNLNIRNEYSGINYYTWWIINTGFEGTMRAIFSMLFGAGAILLLSRLDRKEGEANPADFYYRRLIWLLIFGLINAFIFLWPGDILYSYAICGLFLFPFRKMKPKYLVMFAAGFLLVSTLKQSLQHYDVRQTKAKGEQALALEKKKVKLTEEQQEAKGRWMGMQERMKIENIRKEVKKEEKAMHKGYFSIMSHLKSINVKIESIWFYNGTFFDVMIFLFLGMALFKWGVLTGESTTKFYAILMVAGYVFGIGLAYYMNRTLVNNKFDIVKISHIFYVDLYQFKRIFLSLGHIGLVMLIYKLNIASAFLKMLARVGQMAFTNYLMQSIICVCIFYGFGLRWFNLMERYQLYLVVFGVWIFQIIFSNVWLQYFRFGPFEWVWRSLSYWKKQPFRKHQESVAPLAPELVPAN